MLRGQTALLCTLPVFVLQSIVVPGMPDGSLGMATEEEID
jgi:hypothetical protein